MADNPPQTTDEGQGQVNDISDSDSGIGTGSLQTTPSQSETSTPSQSEMNTPVLSPAVPEDASGTGSFTFPPDVLTTLQINQGATTSQEGASVAMETDSTLSEVQYGHATSSATGNVATTATATATSRPQMDGRGFYPSPDPRTRPTPSLANSATATATSVPQMDSRGFFIQPNPNPSPPVQPKTIQIFIKNFNGKTETLQIREDASVSDLRKLVHNKMGVPPSQQRLNYEGRDLQDGNSILSYNVRNLSTLQLLGRLRGGVRE